MNAYLIRNMVNDKVYVGITTNYRQRWAWHRSAVGRDVPLPLYNAIRKYGPENFTFEIVASARTWADLCAVEAVLIRQHNSYGASGYNATRGGEGALGRISSAEQRVAQSARMMGNQRGAKTWEARRGVSYIPGCHSPEARAKQAAARVGKKASPETIAKRVAKIKGLKRSPEQIANLKAGMATPESRAKRSAISKARPMSAEARAKVNASNRGKKRSAEDRLKQSERQRGTKRSEAAKANMSTAAKLTWATRRAKNHCGQLILFEGMETIP